MVIVFVTVIVIDFVFVIGFMLVTILSLVMLCLPCLPVKANKTRQQHVYNRERWDFTVLGPLKAGLLGKLWKPWTSGPFAHREGHFVPLKNCFFVFSLSVKRIWHIKEYIKRRIFVSKICYGYLNREVGCIMLSIMCNFWKSVQILVNSDNNFIKS